MRQRWSTVLSVLSAVAIVCVGVVGAEALQVGAFVRSRFGRNAARSPSDPGEAPPPAARGLGNEGALDLVTLDWMVRDGVKVRFPGGRTHALPLFTRVPSGMYTLEFYGPNHKPVLCQVQVNPRRRSHVTFGGQDCRVVLND